MFTTFTKAGGSILLKLIPQELRDNFPSLWVVLSLYIFIKCLTLFKGAEKEIENSKYVLRKLLTDGIRYVEFDQIVSPSFVAYLWTVLEIWATGNRKHPGPHNQDLANSYSTKLANIQGRFQQFKGRELRYQSSKLLKLIRIQQKNKKKEEEIDTKVHTSRKMILDIKKPWM
jgi:hypothetical protein